MSGFNHPAYDSLRKPIEFSFDAVDSGADTMPAAATYTEQDTAVKAASAVVVWSETLPEELGDSETLVDRLISLLIGIADFDKDGEISPDEADVFDAAANAAWDFIAGKGASEEDLSALFNDGDNDAAERVQELVGGSLPSSYDAIDDQVNAFVFGPDSTEAALDAVYKKVVAFKNGKKTMLKKRVSGVVRHTPAQKAAIMKMLRKSHSATAQRKRAKSMKMRKSAGM